MNWRVLEGMAVVALPREDCGSFSRCIRFWYRGKGLCMGQDRVVKLPAHNSEAAYLARKFNSCLGSGSVKLVTAIQYKMDKMMKPRKLYARQLHI